MSNYAYKWLGGPHGLSSTHGGDHEWVVGEWVSVKTPVIPCEHGIHLCDPDNLVAWCAPALWVAEYDGEAIGQSDKIVVERARVVRRVETWTETSARLFAADCAERALLRERAAGREPDARSWAAIDAARAYARGEITDAARDAAWAAASAAAWATAWATASDAAWAAVRAAASDAASDAAWAAAWAAVRAAASDAAWAAARAAARDAAWAARAAERAWQLDHLLAMLGPTARLDWAEEAIGAGDDIAVGYLAAGIESVGRNVTIAEAEESTDA